MCPRLLTLFAAHPAVARSWLHNRARWAFAVCFVAWFSLAGRVPALELIPSPSEPAVFGGAPAGLELRFENQADREVDLNLQSRIFQRSSSTLMPLGPAQSWQRLKVLPRQTVIARFTNSFPLVRARTLFEVRILDQENAVIGRQIVSVFPTNLLQELAGLAGDKPLGVSNLGADWGTLLRQQNVPTADLSETGTERFEGKVAIVGSAAATTESAQRVQALLKGNIGVVWIHPDRRAGSAQSELQVHRAGSAALILLRPDVLRHFPADPIAQLRLIQAVRLATAANPVDFFAEP